MQCNMVVLTYYNEVHQLLLIRVQLAIPLLRRVGHPRLCRSFQCKRHPAMVRESQTVTVHKARKVPHLPTNLSYSWLSMHIYLMWWTRLSTSYCLGRNQNHGPCPKNIPRYTCPIQPASWSTTRHFKGERAIKTAAAKGWCAFFCRKQSSHQTFFPPTPLGFRQVVQHVRNNQSYLSLGSSSNQYVPCLPQQETKLLQHLASTQAVGERRFRKA